MLAQLVALTEGPSILLDKPILLIGRHQECDIQIASRKISRRHCCIAQVNDHLVVRDLCSTNGIRINGQRVEIGRLRAGDELSIAHIRYRLENGQAHEQTIAEPGGLGALAGRHESKAAAAGPPAPVEEPPPFTGGGENALAAAVRKLLPVGVADKCRIQVIVQMSEAGQPAEELPAALAQDRAAEHPEECHSDSSH